MFEKADESLINKFNKTLGDLSFRSIFSVFSSVVLALPLVIIRDDYVESVIEILSYFIFFFWILALILYCLYLKLRKPFSHWIVYGSFPIKDDSTIKVIHHFSHNGHSTYDELREYTKDLGVIVSYDGLEIEI